MNSLRIDPGMVHEILSSPNIPFGEKARVMQVKSAVTNLENMLSVGSPRSMFSICDVDKVIEVLTDTRDKYRAVLASAKYKELHCLHCVSWFQMPVVFQKEVQTKVWELILPLVAKQFDFDKYLGSATVVEEGPLILSGPTVKRRPWEVWK